MGRAISKLVPGWWGFTTLDSAILEDAARIDEKKLRGMGRASFTVHFYDTVKEFFLAEALEYIDAWSQSTLNNPAGICGPIGPTEQLPLVARLVNYLGSDLKKDSSTQFEALKT